MRSRITEQAWRSAATLYVDGKPLAEHLVEGRGCRYEDIEEYSDTDVRRTSKSCSEYAETAGSRTYRVLHDAERPERDAHRATLGASDARDFPAVDRPFVPNCPTDERSRAADGPVYQRSGTLVETRRGAGPCELQVHYVAPEDHVFVLGDNRANSNDSRY